VIQINWLKIPDSGRIFVPLLAMKMLVSIALFVFVHCAWSQTTNAYILYNIDVIALDTSLENQQAVGLLQGSHMEIYLADQHSRCNFKMGELYTTSVIADYLKSEMLFLYKGANGQQATLSPIDGTISGKSKADTLTKVTFFDDTKEILGYRCHKAITSLNGIETIYWYTDEISIDVKDQQFSHPTIPGFPLYFSTVDEGVLMEYQIASLDLDAVQSSDHFSTEVPEGYSLQR
jgi:hypothetical protein